MKDNKNSDPKDFISGLEKEMDDSIVKETDHDASLAGNVVEIVDAKSLPRRSKLVRFLLIGVVMFVAVLLLLWR